MAEEDKMNEFLIGVYVGLGLIGIVALFFGFLALIYFMAKNDIFFTLVKEGTAKSIMRFNKFRKIKMSYKNHYLDEEWNVVTDKEKCIFHWIKRFFLKIMPFNFGGLRWVGIPLINSVHSYRFRWVSFEQAEEGGKITEKPIQKEEIIKHILVQDDVYYVLINDAETKGMVPVNVILLLTLRVVNPYKALFRIQHWLEAATNRVKPAFRSFVATKDFEELIFQKEALEGAVGSFLRESQIDEFLEESYGIKLVAAEMVKIEPAGERGKTYIEAASKKWEAGKEKQKVETLADAEIQRMERVYEKITSYGEAGLFIRAIEGIEQASKGPSNLVVFPLGSVKDLVKGWIGGGEKK